MRKSIGARLLLLFLGLLSVTQVLPMYPVAACNPDFTLTFSQTSLTVQAGSSVGGRVTVTSVCGLTGTINVLVLLYNGGISPTVKNGPTVTFRNYDLYISPTRPSLSTIVTISTTKSTPSFTYTITITGKDITNGLTHTVTFTLTVT
jgi:hypothetical protein